MADISLIIEVQGQDDVLKATKATDRLEKQITELNRAFRTGKISQSDYIRGLNQLSSRNAKAAGGYNRLKSEVFKYASNLDQAAKENYQLAQSQKVVNNNLAMGQNQYARYNTSVYRSNQQTKRFASVGLQQAGYQVGDFAVQVQGGTNVAVAFGQQMSQLLGIFGAFGAVAGAAVAIITAIVAPLIDARSRTKELTDATNDLSEAFDLLEKTDVLEYYESISEGVDKVIDRYRALLESVQRVAKERRAGGLSAIVTELAPQADIQETSNYIALLEAQIGKYGVNQDEINSKLEEQRKILSDQKAVREAILSIQGETRLQTAENLSNAIAELETQGALTSELEKQLVNFAEKNGLIIEATSAVEEEAEKTKEVSSSVQQMINMLKEGPASWRNINDVIDQSISKVNRLVTISSRFFSQAQAIGGIRSMDLAGQYAQYGQGRQAADRLMAEFRYSIGQQFPGYSPEGDTSGGGGSRTADAATQGAKKLNDALKELNSTAITLGETMSKSMGDAFMAIVDGSKDASDAFRDMARQILKKAFDLLVIQPLMNQLFGGFGQPMSSGGFNGLNPLASLGFANGAAFRNGQVTAFANGGVVSQPTIFPMANGMGLMGEAGPEAVMPLTRTKGGKLGVVAEGSGEQVVINQNFNFSANGDESVKKIIAQEAPKIAQYTKNSFMEDRRRGGVVKATFGG